MGFLDHMLPCYRQAFWLILDRGMSGDLHFDDRHALEDVGTSLGLTFHEAVPQVKGVKRLHQAL